jgi:AcrR family transcriptional regulator
MTETKSGNKQSDSQMKILEAATTLFGRKGYHASTIENITDAAGISRGALYWHFNSKSEVLAAVVERLQREYLDRFIEETLQAGPTAVERLKGIFRFTAKFAVEHTDLVHCLRTLSLELSPSESEQVEAFFRIVDRQRDFIVSIVSEGQKEGVVRNDIEPTMLAAIILAIHDGILLQWTAFRHLWSGKDLAKAFRRVTLDGISQTGRFDPPGHSSPTSSAKE